MLIKNIDFSKFSNINIGGQREIYIIEDIDEVSQLPKKFKIVGGANNILISPRGVTPLGQLSKKFDFLRVTSNYLHIGGATPNGKIFNFAKHHNLSGFEFLQYLPSTLGGAIKMNAGLKEYEIFNNLIAVKTEHGWIEREKINFSYRHTEIDGIIFEAKFKLLQGFNKELVALFKDMRSNQPKEPSLGSTFKNPPNLSAGQLIEQVGLKGFKIGNMAFSKLHANFLINLGNGKFEDGLKLIQLAETRVFEEFGIKLKKEIEIVE